MSECLAPETTIAYCAGLFDGEGCISLHRVFTYAGRKETSYGKHPNYRYRINIVVNQVDFEAIKVLYDTFGGQVRYKERRRLSPTGRPYSARWWWEEGDRRAVAILQQMLPYLRLKAAQAELALQVHATKLPALGEGKGARSRKLGRTPEEVTFQAWAFEEMKRLKHLHDDPATHTRNLTLAESFRQVSRR